MAAVARIVEQLAHHRRRGLQVVDGFEQRRDVERHLAVDGALGDARQCEHRQRIGRAARHRDDVEPGRGGAVAAAQVDDRTEHTERGRDGVVRGRVTGLRRRVEHRVQAGHPAFDVARGPVAAVEMAEHLVVQKAVGGHGIAAVRAVLAGK